MNSEHLRIEAVRTGVRRNGLLDVRVMGRTDGGAKVTALFSALRPEWWFERRHRLGGLRALFRAAGLRGVFDVSRLEGRRVPSSALKAV